MLGVVLASLALLFLTQNSVHMRADVVPKLQLSRWRHAAYPWLLTIFASDLFIEFHILLTGYMAAASEVAVLHVAFRFRVLAAFGMRSIYTFFFQNHIFQRFGSTISGAGPSGEKERACDGLRVQHIGSVLCCETIHDGTFRSKL